MNPNNHFKAIQRTLEAQRADLLRALNKREEIQIERASDSLDEIQNAANRDLAVRLINREGRLLRQVEAALQRVKDHTYGVCQECEEEITPRRLAAVPWAEFCIRCQERMDAAHSAGEVDEEFGEREPVYARAA